MGKHKWTAWKERKCFETSEDYFHKSINAWHPFHLPGKEQFLRQNGWLSKHPLFSFTKCVLDFCLKNVFCQIKERVLHQCCKKCNEESTRKDKNPKILAICHIFWRLQKKKEVRRGFFFLSSLLCWQICNKCHGSSNTVVIYFALSDILLFWPKAFAVRTH